MADGAGPVPALGGQATRDGGDGGRGDTEDTDDLTIAHRRLRAALELAVDLAGADQLTSSDAAAIGALRQPSGRGRLAASELGRVRRALDAAPTLRAAVVRAATEHHPDRWQALDELCRSWLERPAGWRRQSQLLLELEGAQELHAQAESALRKEQKRRESAERKRERAATSAGHTEQRIGQLADQAADLRRQLDEQAARLTEVRAQLVETRNAERHATDRQHAAEQRRDELQSVADEATARAAVAEIQRDELLAERAGGDSSLGGSAVSDVRSLATELRQRAEQLHRLVSPPAAEPRRPLAVPGAVADDPVATGELLLRSGALVLVDGYNVAKGAWPDASLAEQRQLLLDGLDNVARRFGTELVVVFDGADVVGSATQARRLSRVRYSPADITADDVIRDEVAAAPPQRQIVVVTNDREIQRDVTRQGANVLASDALADIARR